MARTQTPLDGAVILTALLRQATGQQNLTEINASNYVSAGESLRSVPRENLYNAMGMILGRTMIAVRPISQSLINIQAENTGIYSHRLRKVSFYSKNPLQSGYFNTDVKTNFAPGYTSGDNNGVSTKSQWEQNPAMPVELNFGGSTVWDDCITMYEDKLEAALRNPIEMEDFVAGYLTEHGNDIIREKEAFNRMTLLARMALAYYCNQTLGFETAVNLTELYNATFGTSYSSEALRTTQLTSFLQFMTAVIRDYSDRLERSTALFHDPLTKTVEGTNYGILRHTRKDYQKLWLYTPLFRLAESVVYSSIFNPQYLDMSSYEKMTFWQGEDNRAAVLFNGSVYDQTTGEQKPTGTVNIPYVVGFLMDKDAALTDFQLERVLSTPLEARKGFRNVWLHMSKNAIVDQTENAVLFYMQDAD